MNASVAAQVGVSSVRIAETQPAEHIGQCGGPPTLRAGTVTLERTGDTSVSLSVTFTIAGPVTPTSGTATFAPNDATTAIAVTPTGDGYPTFLFTIEPGGGGYTIGDPSQAEVTAVVYGPSCVQGTTTTVATPDTLARTGPISATDGAPVGVVIILVGVALLTMAARWHTIRRSA